MYGYMFGWRRAHTTLEFVVCVIAVFAQVDRGGCLLVVARTRSPAHDATQKCRAIVRVCVRETAHARRVIVPIVHAQMRKHTRGHATHAPVSLGEYNKCACWVCLGFCLRGSKARRPQSRCRCSLLYEERSCYERWWGEFVDGFFWVHIMNSNK